MYKSEMAADKVGLKFDLPTILLVIYVLYAIISIGMTGLLFSVAIGLILYGVVDSYPLLVAAIILSGIVWKVWLQKYLNFREGFNSGVPVYNQSGASIAKRIANIQVKEAPTGFLSSSFVEGFADADPSSATTVAPTTASAPAAAAGQPVSSQMAAAVPAAGTVAAMTPAAVPATSEPFKNEGGFKLGQLPSEVAGGFHIDAGTTLMNAMNSLKPDQIQAMTTDTKSLLETQKSLMGMLQTMKPMLNDGKQLMETFHEMFGNQK
jgi:hypothetical protein